MSPFSLSIHPVPIVFLVCPFLCVGDLNHVISTGIIIITCIMSCFHFLARSKTVNGIAREGVSINASRPRYLLIHHGDFPPEEIN